MSNKNETRIIVGQTIYSQLRNKGSHAPLTTVHHKVSKIGNKFTYLEGNSRMKIDISTLRSVSDFMSIQFYRDEQEILDRQERTMIYDILRKEFDYLNYNSNKFSLEQLREVAKILNLFEN